MKSGTLMAVVCLVVAGGAFLAAAIIETADGGPGVLGYGILGIALLAVAAIVIIVDRRRRDR